MSFMRKSSVHKPREMRSRTKGRFTCTNSPESVRLTYKFCVYGSKLSLLPRIWAVLAVGIGATRSEFRRPCCAIFVFKAVQSQRPLFGVRPHKSNCSWPLLAGEPAKVSYGPSRSDNSHDASHAAK